MPDDNIIPFQHHRKIDTSIKEPQPPPMFNIPPATKILTGLIVVIHLIILGLSVTLIPNADSMAAVLGGFTPASWTNPDNFNWITPFTIITFSFLHGGWMHLGFNTVLLVAMGSGLEKSIGIKQYFYIYCGSTLCALLAHMALYPLSSNPIIGASGGISGIFGAMIYLMNKTQNDVRNTQHRSRMIPIIVAYIGITALIGMIGGPDGASVAWIAHIGGFLSGIGIMMFLLKNRT